MIVIGMVFGSCLCMRASRRNFFGSFLCVYETDTEDSILAECAVNDRIWGIGLSMKDSNRLESEKWRGQNLLGYALMMVRNWINDVWVMQNKRKGK